MLCVHGRQLYGFGWHFQKIMTALRGTIQSQQFSFHKKSAVPI